MEQKETAQQRDDLVIGRNSVLELLKTDRAVECIYLQRGLCGTVQKIAGIAKDKGIVVKDVAQIKLDNLCAHSNHQGVVAVTAAAHYSQLEDIFLKAGDEPVFILIADEIEDPHNLGAIIRCAEGAGAHGIIIPKRRSAGLNFVVSKTSAGAVEHMPVVRVANLVTTMEQLKKLGVWIYGADMDGASWCSLDYKGPLALVVGSEGRGVGRLVKETCDFTVALPMRGKVDSLNASVAAGILLYEIARQRLGLPSFAPKA